MIPARPENIFNPLKRAFQSYRSVFSATTFNVSVVLFAVIIIFINYLPHFFDNSKIKFHLVQRLTKTLEANFSIKGELELLLLPTPSVVANDVFIENYKPKDSSEASKGIYNIHAKKLRIYFPLFSVFDSKLIKKIVAEDLLVEVIDNDSIKLGESGEFNKLLAKQPKGNEVALEEENSTLKNMIFSIDDVEKSIVNKSIVPDIFLNNGKIIFYNKFGKYRQIENLSARLKIKDKIISSKGSFVSENILNKFDLFAKFDSKSSKSDSYFEITSDALSMKIEGIFASQNQGYFSDFKGNLVAEIKNFKKFYKTFVSSNNLIVDGLKDETKSVKISSDISSSGSEIKINNIDFNSSVINGKAEIGVINSKDKSLIDLKFDIESFDLDHFWSYGNFSKNDQEIIASISDQNVSLNKPQSIEDEISVAVKNIDLNAEFNFKKLIFKDAELKDVNLYSTVANEGKIGITPLVFKIGDNSLFRLNGIIDNSTAIPKFIGNFDGIGSELGENLKWIGVKSDNLKFDVLKKFHFYSDLIITPYETNLNRLYLNLNEGESEVVGDIKINKDLSNRRISSNLKVNQLTIEKYFLLSRKNAYFSKGSLIKKLFWLNEIDSFHNIKLNFENLYYKDQVLQDQEFTVAIGKGYIVIPSTKIKSTDNDLTFNIAIDISDRQQKFDLSLKAQNLHLSSQEVEQNKIVGVQNDYDFFDQFYDLPSIEKFDGSIDIDVGNFQIDSQQIRNFLLKAEIKDGTLNPAILKFNVYGGDLDFKGLIQAKDEKIINGIFSLNRVEIRSLLSDLFQIKNISGTTNVAGNILSVASDKKGFIERLKSQISFVIAYPVIENYGLSDLVRKMLQLQTNRVELDSPEKIVFESGGKTSFKEAKGFIEIKNGNEGKFKIKLNAPALNSVFSGNLVNSSKIVEGTLNSIFLTGNSQRQIPINVAVNLKYKPKTLIYISNFDQVRQYLGLSRVDSKSVVISNDEQKNDPSKDEINNLKLASPLANSSFQDLEKEGQDIENKSNNSAALIDQNSQEPLKSETKSKTKEISTEPIDKID